MIYTAIIAYVAMSAVMVGALIAWLAKYEQAQNANLPVIFLCAALWPLTLIASLAYHLAKK